MRRTDFAFAGFTILLVGLLAGCQAKGKMDSGDGAPPAPNVTEEPDLNLVKVDRPERFKIVTAGEREELPEINVTGVVNPDVEKSIPVISLATGRVVGIYAKLGDDVTKGQLLLKVYSPDISNAFQNLRQAQADEALAQKQLERAKLLYEHGAIALNDLQVAEDTEAKAKATLDAAIHAIRILGGDPAHEDAIVGITAPVSGTIVEQNVTPNASVQSNNQPNLFTIANLSTVWVICNVYENDLPNVRVGDPADVELNAYRGSSYRGRVVNIGKVLDSTIRTAPVRVVLKNPGNMRAGMFVTATFYGQHGRKYATVATTAVLHLHDRDWVFVPAAQGQFRRTEVTAGKIIDGQQDLLSGISPGQKIVDDALALSAETEQ
jgi:membrane fusion protein, heavy metal efflux system